MLNNQGYGTARCACRVAARLLRRLPPPAGSNQPQTAQAEQSKAGGFGDGRWDDVQSLYVGTRCRRKACEQCPTQTELSDTIISITGHDPNRLSCLAKSETGDLVDQAS